MSGNKKTTGSPGLSKSHHRDAFERMVAALPANGNGMGGSGKAASMVQMGQEQGLINSLQMLCGSSIPEQRLTNYTTGIKRGLVRLVDAGQAEQAGRIVRTLRAEFSDEVTGLPENAVDVLVAHKAEKESPAPEGLLAVLKVMTDERKFEKIVRMQSSRHDIDFGALTQRLARDCVAGRPSQFDAALFMRLDRCSQHHLPKDVVRKAALMMDEGDSYVRLRRTYPDYFTKRDTIQVCDRLLEEFRKVTLAMPDLKPYLHDLASVHPEEIAQFVAKVPAVQAEMAAGLSQSGRRRAAQMAPVIKQINSYTNG